MFETLGAALNPETAKMHSELSEIEAKINNLGRLENSSYTSQVSKSFYLGMVGGSGRNTYRLNQRREREMDKPIERAKILVELYKKRDNLKASILYIESGKRDQDKIKKDQTNIKLADYWKSLKAGDFIDIGNGKTEITKKNAKSLETGSGCKWYAAEIIGKKAAALL